jgi:ubiquitin-protein ligase
MLSRRQREIELLEEKYGEVEHDQHLKWVLFKNVSLPEGWNRSSTDILILIPDGYPVSPPDNFSVDSGLRTASGSEPKNYGEGQHHFGREWGQFSVHILKETWSPSNDILNGTNLITYMMVVVEKRLREVN